MRSRVTQQLDHLFARRAASSASPAGFKAGAPATILPDGFSAHDYAVFLLQVASEIEHSLLVQYLFAAYTMGGPAVPKAHRDDVRRWQTLLLGIAREEMGHFITVQNLLKLIGGPLNLERNDYPWDQPFYPFPFTLEPFSRRLVARYVCIESPRIWPANWAHLKDEIEILAFGGGGGFNRVGVIYDDLKRIIADPKVIPDEIFQADTLPYQASFDEWGRGYKAGAQVRPHQRRQRPTS